MRVALCGAAYGVEVSKKELQAALPEIFDILGPNRFFGIIDAYNEEYSKTADAPIVCQGRLTLTSGTPVTISDVSDATTVYFTPFGGNQISIYNGSRWVIVAFSELGVAVPSTTTTPFDVFANIADDGSLALSTVDWTNDTTRATALTLQNGVYVKSGSTTYRYLGTGRTESDSGQMHDREPNRMLWNYCNRRTRKLWWDIAANWCGSCQSTAWRALNADSSQVVYQRLCKKR